MKMLFLLMMTACMRQAPVVLRVSDAVCPGKLFTINGEGLAQDAEVVIGAVDGRAEAPPSPKFRQLGIVQRDRDGHFVVAMLPADVSPGVYRLRVHTAAGWSRPVFLNAARVLFLSEREAYRGLTLRISGRNLDGREFSMNCGRTKVRLNDGQGHIYPVTVSDINPYCVAFVIGRQPPGTYSVEASNDNGLVWGKLDNGQRLRIVNPPVGSPETLDPLDMGVAWASHFNWRNRYPVPAGRGEDMTGRIQAMIDKAAASPHGGIVYLPAGAYGVSKLLLREHVVLMGEGRGRTVLHYIGHDKDFITCVDGAVSHGHIGVARLSITAPAHSQQRPDIFINLGQSAIWQGATDIHKRTAAEMFVVGVAIDYDLTETRKDRRGLPVCSIGKERLYVANCRFVGFRMESHNYVSEYVTVRDNYAEFAMGVFVYTGDFLFLENNRINGHTEINREKHGFMIRANSYLYNNVVAHTGSKEGPGNDNFNDGEAICNETPGGTHNFGYVRTAGRRSLTAGYTYGPFRIPSVEIYNHRSVLIVHGKGLGQLRRVASMDTASRRITVDRAWTVIPDSTSRFTLIEPNENIVYYKNTIIDNPKGYWLFGNSIDCVVAANNSIDCDGIFLFSCIYTNDEDPQYYFAPNYFNRIIHNRISGISRKSRRAGIGMNSTREGRTNGSYVGVTNYGNEIRDNYITGQPAETPLAQVTEAPAVSGIFIYSTVHSSAYDGKNVAGDATNQIVEGNTLHELRAGINLSRCCYGQVLRDNTGDSTVGILINDSTGSQQTLVLPRPKAPLLSLAYGPATINIQEGRDGFWEYRTRDVGRAVQVDPPVFELDGKKTAGYWKNVTQGPTDTLPDGVVRFRVAGSLLQDSSLRLTAVFQLAPHNPIVKFRYVLSASRPVLLTKKNGCDALRYLSVPGFGTGDVTEIRLSEYNEKDHAYTLSENAVSGSAFADSAALMGPILVSSSGGYSRLLAYEHGSEYPNRFVEYRLFPDRRIAVHAVKSNYLARQPVDSSHPYETIWFQLGAVAGDVSRLASTYRKFILHYDAEQNASRTPYIYYNTWGRQERVKWAGGTYLSSMDLAYTLKEIEVAHKLGIEVYVLDMGWYQKTGDWNVNTKLFPDTLRQVKALLDKYGMKLGLWFNPTVASVSSDMLRENDANRIEWNGQPDKPFPIWETEESVRLSLVSPYWENYADKLIQLVKQLGVTYFKLDAVYQYAANGVGHFYGTKDNPIEERTESYAFQLTKYLSKVISRVQQVCPQAIFDLDVTEPDRAVGLQFLSSGKYFMFNNGPYFHSFGLTKEWGSLLPSGNAQLFTNPGPARGWFTRPVMRYDKWIPSVLFLGHYQLDGDSASLDINLASAILGANGIWGEILNCTPYQISRTHEILGLYKQVRDDITESDPVITGVPGASPEIYEKINDNGRGAIVVFAEHPGAYTYISRNAVSGGCWHTAGADVRVDKDGHAVVQAHFTKPGAQILFFGLNQLK